MNCDKKLLLLIALFAIAAPVVYGNPFIEVYLQDWEDGIGEWYSKLGDVEDPIKLVFDPHAPSPTQVHEVTREEAATNYLSGLRPVKPGQHYSVGAWINWVHGGWPFVGIARFNESKGRIGLPGYDPGTAPHLIWLIGLEGYDTREGYESIGDLVTPVPVVKGWNYYEKDFIVPEGTYYIRITTELLKRTLYPGRDDKPPLAYFDDISLNVSFGSIAPVVTTDLSGPDSVPVGNPYNENWEWEITITVCGGPEGNSDIVVHDIICSDFVVLSVGATAGTPTQSKDKTNQGATHITWTISSLGPDECEELVVTVTDDENKIGKSQLNKVDDDHPIDKGASAVFYYGDPAVKYQTPKTAE